MPIRPLGTHNGKQVTEAVLENARHRIAIMNYGCVMRDWRVNTDTGIRHIVLGFDSFDPYPKYSPSFGIIAGRVANRTADSQFTLAGNTYQLVANEGNHHLHGGPVGLGKVVWDMEADSSTNSVELKYQSRAGDQGYPANLDCTVQFKLTDDVVRIEMHAQPDRPTPVNLAQHNYYNLDALIEPSRGQVQHLSDCRDHSLQIDAEYYLPVDSELIPTGELQSVAGTRFDFRKATAIREVDVDDAGHDHNLVLNTADSAFRQVATLKSSSYDLQLALSTDQPGLQLYTGKKLSIEVAGHQDVFYKPFNGVCLEPQHFPNALNQSDWPSIIASPEKPYTQTLELEVG